MKEPKSQNWNANTSFTEPAWPSGCESRKTVPCVDSPLIDSSIFDFFFSFPTLLNLKLLIYIILNLLWTPIGLSLLKARYLTIVLMEQVEIHTSGSTTVDFWARTGFISFIYRRLQRKGSFRLEWWNITVIRQAISTELQISFLTMSATVQEEIIT